MTVPELVVVPDAPALAAEAARRCVEIASAAVTATGRFALALAGGSTPAGLYRLLAGPPYAGEIDWARTQVFFGDERCVPPEHPDSNFRMARAALLDHVPIPAANVHRMQGELDGESAATAYAAELRVALQIPGPARPELDLVLLGIGDDGHTASLFPGMPALDETQAGVVWTPVPGYVHPAVPRLTLTLPVINAAHHVIFMVAGAAKAPALAAVLSSAASPGGILPAARVRPEHGSLAWLVDRFAGIGLNEIRGIELP